MAKTTSKKAEIHAAAVECAERVNASGGPGAGGPWSYDPTEEDRAVLVQHLKRPAKDSDLEEFECEVRAVLGGRA